MKKALPIIIVLVVLVAGLAYFLTRNNNSSNSSTPPNNTSSTDNNPPAATQATDKVTIENMAFTPADITIKKGTAVTWTNRDSVAHTVVETDGQDGPNSNDLSNGQSYTFTYNTVGTFKYHCSIHPMMTGTVTVTE